MVGVSVSAAIAARLWTLAFFWVAFLPGDGPSEPVRVGASFDNVSAIGNAVNQRFAQPSVRDHLRPFRKWQVRGENDGCLFGTLSDDLKQELRADFRQWDIADFVD